MVEWEEVLMVLGSIAFPFHCCYRWYHGQLTRSDAEEILKDYADFSFLVRKSESCQTDYSLSIR